jgi:hypothetical protein
MKEPTEDAFVNDILRSHSEKVKKAEERQKQLEKKKKIQEMKHSYLHSIRSKPDVDLSLKYLQNRPVRIPSHQPPRNKPKKQTPKLTKIVEGPVQRVAQKRPLIKLKPPEIAKKRKLTPAEIEEEKRIKELTLHYYQNMDAGVPEELDRLLKKSEARDKKEEEEEITILDWKTNRPIKKVIRKKGDTLPINYETYTTSDKSPPVQKTSKPAPQKVVQQKNVPAKVNTVSHVKEQVAPVQRKVSVRPQVAQKRVERPMMQKRATPEYEADSMDDFISDDDEEYDPLALKELNKLTGNYREKYRNHIDEDIPEAKFDMISHEERITARIGRKEDEVEELRQRKHGY